MGELEVFRKQIPEQVKVVYLVDQPWLTRWRQQKITRRLLFYIKMYDEALLSPIRRQMIGSKLRQLAASLGIVDDVVFLGFSSNPYPWIAHAKAIAHSAKFEGLPTVMIESLIIGKLIVATDCPTGPREILDQGRAGLLTPVGDAEKMAEALHLLLTDSTLQTDILAAAQRHKQQFLFELADKLFDEAITS